MKGFIFILLPVLSINTGYFSDFLLKPSEIKIVPGTGLRSSQKYLPVPFYRTESFGKVGIDRHGKGNYRAVVFSRLLENPGRFPPPDQLIFPVSRVMEKADVPLNRKRTQAQRLILTVPS